MKDLKSLGRKIGRDVTALSNAGGGLVKHLVAYGWVWAHINNRTIGTGIDKAVDVVKDEGCPVTEGFFKKAVSFAKAVGTHGGLKGMPLVGTDEGDLIEQALAHLAKVNVSAAVAARVAENGGKKGGRPTAKAVSVQPTPEAATPPAPPAPEPQGDPLLAAETAAAQAIQKLIEAGATDALARLTTMLLAAAQKDQAKAA